MWADDKSDVWQKVSDTVASQQRLFPSLKGKTVMPSGLLPSPRSKPTGSSIAGIPAVASALLTIVLLVLPGIFLCSVVVGLYFWLQRS